MCLHCECGTFCFSFRHIRSTREDPRGLFDVPRNIYLLRLVSGVSELRVCLFLHLSREQIPKYTRVGRYHCPRRGWSVRTERFADLGAQNHYTEVDGGRDEQQRRCLRGGVRVLAYWLNYVVRYEISKRDVPVMYLNEWGPSNHNGRTATDVVINSRVERHAMRRAPFV